MFFAGAGVVGLVTLPLPAPGSQPAATATVYAVALALGIAIWFAPWGSWSRAASLAIVPPAFALIAVGNAFGGEDLHTYGVFFVVAFVWIGMAHPPRRFLFDGGQEFPAGLLTAPAGLLTDPAVLVMLGMPPALVAAALAGGHAGFQQWPGDAGVVVRLAADYPGGGGADIDAIQAQPDALDHLGQVLLCQVGVGVGGAGLGAVAERVDGGGQHAGVSV